MHEWKRGDIARVGRRVKEYVLVRPFTTKSGVEGWWAWPYGKDDYATFVPLRAETLRAPKGGHRTKERIAS